jgi:hypothetical protein
MRFETTLKSYGDVAPGDFILLGRADSGPCAFHLVEKVAPCDGFMTLVVRDIGGAIGFPAAPVDAPAAVAKVSENSRPWDPSA